MKIEILGTGCPKCKRLHKLVEKVIADTGASAELSNVDKIDDIIEYGVMMTPALVIDGTVKAVGGLPKVAQIETWLKEAAEG